eukprot:5248568-Alexandrium_andersonii.AAC.2
MCCSCSGHLQTRHRRIGCGSESRLRFSSAYAVSMRSIARGYADRAGAGAVPLLSKTYDGSHLHFFSRKRTETHVLACVLLHWSCRHVAVCHISRVACLALRTFDFVRWGVQWHRRSRRPCGCQDSRVSRQQGFAPRSRTQLHVE